MSRTKKEAVKTTNVVPAQAQVQAQEKAKAFFEHLSKNYENEEIKVTLHCPDIPIFTNNGESAKMIFDNLNRHIGFNDMVSHIKVIGQLAPEDTFTIEWVKGNESIKYEWVGDKFAHGTKKLLRNAVKYSKHIGSDGKILLTSALLESGYADDVKAKFDIVVAQFLKKQSLAEAIPMIHFLENLPKNEMAKVSFFVGQLLVKFLNEKQAKMLDIEIDNDF